METAELIKSLVREGQLLATAAEKAGPDASVRTCPGWQVRDLLRHVGKVHRWATAFVTEGYTTFHPDDGEPDLDGDELLEWFRDGHGLLVAALSEAPADLECWTFLPASSPLAFWARRQAHETTVHRVDAESALGGKPGPVAADFAVDGIEELLTGFHGRSRSKVRSEAPLALRLRPIDTDDVWTVWVSTDVPRTEPSEEGPADCELSGTAEQLYLTLWNRLPLTDVSVTGDIEIAELWRELSPVTWS
ncbi:maleylpyruvate isomerase family mycothiol-dependent enzyme [Streptomyces lunaelactis]|uniref:maleylpyruvate isomerase family mycothiol-dependent enzyme n=1 Tax=Streptomyces lunaelactis TaxID=1535768 RepID=UPI001585225E|nr:maleylpyruvate isomerase family mycothiol-dependent enzyme [Streptomyces lunaelactis]NUK33452.1 maleylpyruvate isomerase family mycothiol-dependent enzyme [Streptomyces lunaelactis]NUK42592.1 maleylpyruvate isomerase family mycothiol-dependent enzyme [Streptomyces lunaelactis]NUK71479.1 maleylpyruvate isomerase family mycothiol-dependent enzyme [Streptomyces lunaelactis]NUK77204.1 maleylpyruvate isomerase family mycothiol-dependent enzyme [Streptomyces lunaelactis]NUK96841.1 maleylpyruvate 